MGTILASAIIDRAENILQDTSNLRWQATEMLASLNDGQREIVLLKPDANVTTAAVVCVAGSKQTIPTAGIALIDVTRNMGANGTTAGNAVVRTTKDVLDRHDPTWHTITASAAAEAWWMDDRNPTVFWVYPKQPTSAFGYLELVYSALPTDIASVSTAISLHDIYAGVLLDYLLYRCAQKSVAYAPEWAQRAATYQAAFMNALGIKEQVESVNSPNAKDKLLR